MSSGGHSLHAKDWAKVAAVVGAAAATGGAAGVGPLAGMFGAGAAGAGEAAAAGAAGAGGGAGLLGMGEYFEPAVAAAQFGGEAPLTSFASGSAKALNAGSKTGFLNNPFTPKLLALGAQAMQPQAAPPQMSMGRPQAAQQQQAPLPYSMASAGPEGGSQDDMVRAFIERERRRQQGY